MVSNYLHLVQKSGLTPNFWMSVPYLRAAGAVPVLREGYLGLYDDGQLMFPEMSVETALPRYSRNGIPVQYWAGFPGEAFPSGTFLDYQFEYLPSDFLELEGGRWKTFRKNLHKWKGVEGLEWVACDDARILVDLFASWAEEAPDDMIEDAETIVSLISNRLYGAETRLLTLNGEPLGFVLWDSNHVFINFRYCFVKPGRDGLSEYMRWRFMTQPEVLYSGKLVNDGGSLGREGLTAFKHRLNPICVTTVNTTIPTGEQP